VSKKLGAETDCSRSSSARNCMEAGLKVLSTSMNSGQVATYLRHLFSDYDCLGVCAVTSFGALLEALV
jgi:hypothetical protein